MVTVPARNTSRHCPHCLEVLRHRKASDRPTTPGWKWALCGSCGWQGDRDQGAWKRIAARGLTHQARTVTDRTTGAMAIRSVIDTLEAGAVITPTVPKTCRVGPVQDRTHPALHRTSGAQATPDTHHQPTPATRSSPGRGIPPPRPRHPSIHPSIHPSTVGKSRARHHV
ncbi:zinc ribbon domain-containing protein [Streptomyces yerevanensis]|uniref:zinc ribbon domain-containing protein n=1 Tax=Streptomyces yerevanensis TaxID=66378 RepID=UPI000AB51479